MMITNYLKRSIAVQANKIFDNDPCKPSIQLLDLDDFSILRMFPDSVNGHTFEILIDGQLETLQVRTNIK